MIWLQTRTKILGLEANNHPQIQPPNIPMLNPRQMEIKGNKLGCFLLSGKACILGPRLLKYTCFMASSAGTLFLDSYCERAKNFFINLFSNYCKKLKKDTLVFRNT